MIQGTEARIHGIGNHKPADSLGSLQPSRAWRDGMANNSVTLGVYVPPTLPDHKVELLSWSRISRVRAKFLWYLVLPFTLANTSDVMLTKKAGSRVGAARIAALAAGLILTLSLLVWVFVAAETFVKRMPWPSSGLSVRIVFVALGVALAVVILRRTPGWRARSAKSDTRVEPAVSTGSGIRVAWTHATAVLLFTLLIVWLQPAQVAAPKFFPSSCMTAPDCHIRDVLDLPVTWVIGSTLVCFVLAACAWIFDRSPSVRPSLPRSAGGVGAAAVLTTAVVVIHTAGGLFVQGLDYLLLYPSRYLVFRQLGGTHALVCPDPSRGANVKGLGECERTLLVFDESAVPTYALNLVSVPVLLLIFVAALIFLGRWGLTKVGWISTPARVIAAQSRHSLVLRAPRLLPVTVVGVWIVVPAISVLTYLTIFAPTSNPGWWYAVIVSLSHVGALVAVLFFVFGWTSPAVKNTFGMIADVLGFWPVQAHPLGGRDYRRDVVSGVHSFLKACEADEVVLVGHSQGSVIGAWVAHERSPQDRPRLALVTCGCPLASLYGTFFPSTFDGAFYSRARESVHSWTNMWRDTDPISTAVPNPSGPETQSLEPARDGVIRTIENTRIDDIADPPRVHSDYWIEEAQANAVTAALTQLREATGKRQDPPAGIEPGL